MKSKLIAGLDIGTTNVRLVLGQFLPADVNGGRLQIIGAMSVPSSGMSRGVISSIEDATSAVSACLEKAERLLGVQVSEVYVGINGPGLKCDKSKGVVAVSRGNNEISQEDINRVVEAAEALSVPQQYSILHVVPMEFKVDNQESVKNPIGMSGIRLEVETLIVQALTSQIKNLTKTIERAGLNFSDLCFSPMAAAAAALDAQQKELGAALINIGSNTTSMVVYEDGQILHTAVIPLGSAHITSDIAIGLRCPITLADKIKIRYGSAKAENFNKKDEVDISDLLNEENLADEVTVVSRYYVAEIIEARVEELLEKIDQELKKIGRSGMLPAGAVLIGGGAKLADLVDVAKKQLRLPVSLGGNKHIPTVVDKAGDPEYLTALGLVAWGEQSNKNVDSGGPDIFAWLKKMLGNLKSS